MMMSNIALLLTEKSQIVNRLAKLLYGSIELREKDDKKYIYVHYREEGKLITRYGGEYSLDLYNVILENSRLAKELKKRLRLINKSLHQLNYIETELTPEIELNIDFARKNLVSSIYKQSALEGVATTYSDTETLVEGGKVNDMTAEDVLKVINLKHAWDFILSKNVINYPTNFELLCQINAIIEEGFSYTAGKIRSTPVTIGRCSYIPPIPFESDIKDELSLIVNENDNHIDVAIKLVLYIMKKQIFLDGNKRTAIIFANQWLIKHGLGLIVIPTEKVQEYKKILVNYYETNEKEKITLFLKNECLMKI